MITFPKSTKKNFPYLVFLKILLLFLRRTIRYSTIVLLDPQNLRPSCFHFSSFSFLPLTPDASGRTATSWLLMWNSYLQKSKEKYNCRRNNFWWWFLNNLLAYVVFKRSPDWCFDIRLLSKQSVKSRIIGDNISLITFFNGKSLSVLHLWLFDENIFRISGNTSLSSFALNQAPFEPNILQPQDVHDKLHSAVNSNPPRCALY